MFGWLTALVGALFQASDDVQRRRAAEKAAQIAAADKALKEEFLAAQKRR